MWNLSNNDNDKKEYAMYIKTLKQASDQKFEIKYWVIITNERTWWKEYINMNNNLRKKYGWKNCQKASVKIWVLNSVKIYWLC